MRTRSICHRLHAELRASQSRLFASGDLFVHHAITYPPLSSPPPCGAYDRRLLKRLAFHTPEQKRLFKLLADAYVHARYTKSYTITKDELDYLADRVRRLQTITEEACREQIAKLA